jgi:hypothetical protein
MSAFEKEPQLVKICGIDPQNLQTLVDHNSAVVSIMLTKLNTTQAMSGLMNQYFDYFNYRFFEKLTQMDLTLN